MKQPLHKLSTLSSSSGSNTNLIQDIICSSNAINYTQQQYYKSSYYNYYQYNNTGSTSGYTSRLLINSIGVTTAMFALIQSWNSSIVYADEDDSNPLSHSNRSIQSSTSTTSPQSGGSRHRRFSLRRSASNTAHRSNSRSGSNNPKYPYDFNDFKHNITEFALGSIAGISSGYTAKAFGRLAIISVLTSAAGMQYLIWHGYIEVNWKKVNDNIQRIQDFAHMFVGEQIRQISNSDANNQQSNDNTNNNANGRSWYVTAGSNLLEKGISLVSSQLMTATGLGFAVGLIVGLKHG